jgi:hypothetical protein
MPDGRTLSWRKSSYSASGDCVEVAVSHGSVWVRDSKQRPSPSLEFPSSDWRSFLSVIRDGKFSPASPNAPGLSATNE